MAKNTFQRILVIVTLFASVALLVVIALDIFKIFEIATDIHLAITVKEGSKHQLTRLDSPVQHLVWLLAVWLVIQFIFFLGLLIQFFKSTKHHKSNDFLEERDVYDSKTDNDDLSPREKISSHDTETDEILEVPKPVGRRSQRDRHH